MREADLVCLRSDSASDEDWAKMFDLELLFRCSQQAAAIVVIADRPCLLPESRRSGVS